MSQKQEHARLDEGVGDLEVGLVAPGRAIESNLGEQRVLAAGTGVETKRVSHPRTVIGLLRSSEG